MEKIKFNRTTGSVPEPQPEPLVSQTPAAKKQGHSVAWIANYPWRLLGGLIAGFLAFFVMADWTAFTTAQYRPGEVIVNNNMSQLWIASYRLIFTVGISIAVIGLAFPFLIHYLRPDLDSEFDFSTSFKRDLTPTHKIWFVFALFSVLCFLFVWLLTVKLPGSLSVGP